MGWIPGWESIQATGWWSGFFFWASIISLIGLGISEVASHRYSERRDELMETQQQADKKRHDDEIALLHLETAKANRDTESAKASIADANSRAAEANARALEAQVALEKFKGPRVMTLLQQTRISAKMAKYKGTKFDFAFGPSGDPEPDLFGRAIEDSLTAAGWIQVDWQTSDLQMPFVRAGRPKAGLIAVTNVFVDIHPSQIVTLGPITEALVEALHAEGYDAVADTGAGGRNSNETAIHILVGRKM